jgi:FtsZ-interacting cell division protein ZipA
MFTLTPTMKKVLIALAVIVVVWFIVKSMSKKRKSRKVIVTRMPKNPMLAEHFDEMDDDEAEGMEAEDDEDDEGYASWEEEEGLDEYASPQFSSDLLTT